MKGTLSFLFFLLIGATSSSVFAQITPIRDCYSLSDYSTVTVEGVINCPDYGFNHGQFFIQDATGGINVFFSNVGGEVGAITNYNEGDSVRINGQVLLYNDLYYELMPNTVDIISTSDDIPAPIKITADDLYVGSEYTGMRVEIEGVTLSMATQWPTSAYDTGSGGNVDAKAGGKSFIIRIDRGQSFYEGSDIPDEPFVLRGTLSRYGDDMQIFPFFEGDISQETTTNTFEALKLDNNIKIYPNPVRESITLEVLPQAGTVDRVVLSDLLGRTVAQFGNLNAKNQTLSLPLPASITKGQYFLSVWTENGIRASKLMSIER